VTGDRGDVDDVAPTPLEHSRQQGPGQKDRREQVGEHEAFGVGDGQLFEGARPAGGGVVDEHVDRAERLCCRARQPLSLIRPGEISLDRVASGSRRHTGKALSIAPRHDHARAGSGKPVRDRLADPTRRSGDEADGARELHRASLRDREAISSRVVDLHAASPLSLRSDRPNGDEASGA
jgi:hypothetical protein